MQHTATHCNTHCNTLQHTATHCNTLQHTATQVHEGIMLHIHITESHVTHVDVALYTSLPTPFRILISI